MIGTLGGSDAKLEALALLKIRLKSKKYEGKSRERRVFDEAKENITKFKNRVLRISPLFFLMLLFIL